MHQLSETNVKMSVGVSLLQFGGISNYICAFPVEVLFTWGFQDQKPKITTERELRPHKKKHQQRQAASWCLPAPLKTSSVINGPFSPHAQPRILPRSPQVPWNGRDPGHLHSLPRCRFPWIQKALAWTTPWTHGFCREKPWSFWGDRNI